MRRIFMLLTMVVGLTACDSGKVFQSYEDMPNNRWPRDRIVSFAVNIEDTTAKYDVELAIRHSTYYAYANLLVNVTSIYPTGEERTKDYDFLLKNTDGSFKAEGAGDLWDITLPLMEAVQFPKSGKYIFNINNIMPLPETADIMQVGLVVKKSE